MNLKKKQVISRIIITITLTMRVMVIKILTYHQTNIFNKNKPYLRNIIVNLQNSDAWNIQLKTAINFTSSKNVEEEHAMHSMNNNIKLTPYSDVNKVVDELFTLFNISSNLETSMRGSYFTFDSVQLMYYNSHK